LRATEIDGLGAGDGVRLEIGCYGEAAGKKIALHPGVRMSQRTPVA